MGVFDQFRRLEDWGFRPFRIRTVLALAVVTMYNYHPCRLAKSNIEKQYFSHCVNDVNDGSPSRMRRVRRISFGMTILPRSSTRRTIHVAFIVFLSLCCISSGIVCRKWGIMREDSHAQTYNGLFVDKQRFSLEITKRPIYTIIGNV